MDDDLAGQDDDDVEIAKRPKNEPNSRPNKESDAYTAPIRVRNGSF